MIGKSIKCGRSRRREWIEKKRKRRRNIIDGRRFYRFGGGLFIRSLPQLDVTVGKEISSTDVKFKRVTMATPWKSRNETFFIISYLYYNITYIINIWYLWVTSSCYTLPLYIISSMRVCISIQIKEKWEKNLRERDVHSSFGSQSKTRRQRSKKQTKPRKAGGGGNEKNDKNGAFSLAFLLLFIIDDYLVETLYTLWSRDNSDELIFFFAPKTRRIFVFCTCPRATSSHSL